MNDETAQKLLMSNHFQFLAQVSTIDNIDPSDREMTKAGFAGPLLDLIFMLDEGKIYFENQDDASVFIRLLANVLNYVYDGKIAEMIEFRRDS